LHSTDILVFDASSIAYLLQENAAIHEGLFLAATLGGMLIARVTPDARFNVLHNLARPPDAREGCLPYPTWRLRTPAKSSSPTKYGLLCKRNMLLPKQCPVCDLFVLVCTTGLHLAVLPNHSHDNKLLLMFYVMHRVFLAPARTTCMGSYQTIQSTCNCRQLPSATLVLAWEKKIYLMDVPLAGLPGTAAGEAQAAAPRGLSAPPPARVLRSWDSEHTV